MDLTDGQREILLGTKQGITIRFKEEDVRAMGRTAHGVRGITLEPGDEVIGMETITPDSTTAILTVTEGGYGKRTPVNEYRVQGRGGKGIISVKTTERNGFAIGFLQVRGEDEIMVMAAQGKCYVVRSTTFVKSGAILRAFVCLTWMVMRIEWSQSYDSSSAKKGARRGRVVTP